MPDATAEPLDSAGLRKSAPSTIDFGTDSGEGAKGALPLRNDRKSIPIEWTSQGTDVFLGRRVQNGLQWSRSCTTATQSLSPNRCLVQRELCNPTAKPKPEISDGPSIHPSTLKSISVTDQSVPLTTGA